MKINNPKENWVLQKKIEFNIIIIVIDWGENVTSFISFLLLEKKKLYLFSFMINPVLYLTMYR